MRFEAQDHLKPKALAGISDDQIGQHWALYESYVKAANGLLEAAAKAKAGSPQWAELRRRLGFEIDGIVLHEYYFGNLASSSQPSPGSDLAADASATWGSVAGWREDFAKTGGMRGVGWAILYHDPATGGLFNWWVSSHDQGHPAGFHPVIVLDVFEHAWMVDHGAGGRAEYIAAFLENVNWEVVEQRYKDSKAGRFTARF
ncbi:MAG TPA: Fe-Mn family superoxide dismutase [Candidatus Nitrosotalea sp.]|jgi:Fe-Mn family superoxide dismutase|nr:Fe-Mn family superoxide dismutase [Candidatus Nitrosotalea sp.]